MGNVNFTPSDGGWWVDLIRAGKWNGSKGGETEVTSDDLNAMVSSFKSTFPKIKPVLRIGDHEDSNGAPKPAVGWVTDLRRVGDKVQAYFEDVPGIVRDAIGKNLFRNVSAGLWRNYEVDGESHPWVLNHVAILGAELPAVNGLDDLGAYLSDGMNVVVFTDAIEASQQKGDGMTIEGLQAQVDNLSKRLDKTEAERDEFKANAEKSTKRVDELTKANDELTKANAELSTARDRAEIETVVDKAIADGKLLPKQKDASIAVGLSAKTASVEFKEGDEGSPYASWTAMLTNGGKVIDTDEKSKTTKADESESDDAAEAEFRAGAEVAARRNKELYGDR